MESEREQNFNDRLNQWIAGQGFWFQLKYSMSGKNGLTGSGGFHLLRLAFRTLVFLLVLGIGASIYLIKLPNTERFAKQKEATISQALKAKGVVLDRFSREQGRMNIVRLSAIGAEDAFYTDFDAKNIICMMGLLDSVRSPWKTGSVTISDLNINLRAGAADASIAETLGDTLFESPQGVELNSIDVERATVSWGFSVFAKGKIEGSHMKVRRREGGWWIQFQGGTFSQNWLKDLEVEELTVICDRDGITIEKGLLKKGSGSLVISGTKVKGAEKPEVDGIAKFSNLPIDDMLPESAAYLVEGTVSGALRLSGSTNSQDGIGMSGKIELKEGDGLVLRERIPLLRALRMVDAFNNYRRVKFQTGTLELKTGAGRMELAEMDLKAGDLMTLKGAMSVRPPTKEEREKSVEHPVSDSPLAAETGAPKPVTQDEFTLRRAAEESRRKAGNASPKNLMETYQAAVDGRQFESNMATRLADSLRYEGELEISVRQDAFDQAPQLKAAYPMDEGSGRIPIAVPISGTLDLVTFPQAEDIYSKGKR